MAKYILEVSNGAPILRGLDTSEFFHFGLDPTQSDSYDGTLDSLGNRGLFATNGSSSADVYLPSTLAGEAVATGHIKFDDTLFPTTNYAGLGLPAEFKLDALQVMPYVDLGTNVGADAHLVSNVASMDVSSALGGGYVGVTASVSEVGWLSIEKAGDPYWVPSNDEIMKVFGAVAEADTSYVNDGAVPDEVYVLYNNGTAIVDLLVAQESGAGDFSGEGWGDEVYNSAARYPATQIGDDLAVFYESSVAASTYSASTLNGLTINPEHFTYVKFIPNADVELLELSNIVYDTMESGSYADIWQFNPDVPNSAMERIIDSLSLSDSDFLFAFAVVDSDHPTARLIDFGEGMGEQYVGALVGNAAELFQEISTGLGDTLYQLIDIGEYQGSSTTKADILAEFAVASSLEESATFVTLDAMVKVADLDVNSALASLGVDYSATSEDNLQVEINTYYVDTLVVSDTMTGDAERILEIITTNDSDEANMWGDTTSLEINAAQSALALDLYTWSAHISDIEIINNSSGAVDLSSTDFGKDDIVTLTAGSGTEFIYDRSVDPMMHLHAPATAVVGDAVKLTLTQDFASTPQFNIVNDGSGVVEFIGQNDVGETIYGTTGADIIIGGDGDDTLHGVAGADTFVFNTDGSGAGDGNDIIIGYDSKGGDAIIIQNGGTALSQAMTYQEYLDSSGTTYFVDASGNYEYSGGTITLAEAQGLVSAVESKFEIVELKDERAGDIMTYGVKVKDAFAWSQFSSVKFGIEWDTSKYKFVENSVLLSHNAAMLDEMSVQFDIDNPNHPYYHNAANGFLDFSITGGIDGFGDPTSRTFTHMEYSIDWGAIPSGPNNVRLNDIDNKIALTGENLEGWYATAKDGIVRFEDANGVVGSWYGSASLEAGLIQVVNAAHTASDDMSLETVYLAFDDPMGGLLPYQIGETSSAGGVFNDVSSNWTNPSFNEVADDYVAKFTMKRIDTEQAINELVLKYSNDSVIYYDNEGNKVAVASTPNSEASVFDYTTDQVTVNVRDADGHSSTTPTKLYVSSDTVSDGLSLVPVMQVGDLVKYNVVMNVASPTLRFNAIEDMPMEAQIWITGAEIFEDSVMQIGYADMGNAGWDNDPAMPDTPPFMATAGTKVLTAQVADSQFDFIKDELEGATDLTGVNVTHQLEITQGVGGLYPTTPLTTRSVDPDAPAVAQHAVAEFWARVDDDGIGFSYRNFTSDDMTNATTKSYSSAISITSEDITGGSDTFTVNDGSNVAVLGDTLYKNPFSNMMAIDNADTVRALQVAVDDPMDRKFDAATYVAADFNKDGIVTGADAYDILVTSAFYSPTDLMDPMDPGYYNALLATPDWMFVEYDYQNGRDLIDLNMDAVTVTDPYFGPITMANSVSFDRYFNKFVGETSKFDVTAILSGDANHSYIPAYGSSAHLADYESILGLTNTATDVTAPGAETFAQATTVVPAGGGVTAGSTVTASSSPEVFELPTGGSAETVQFDSGTNADGDVIKGFVKTEDTIKISGTATSLIALTEISVNTESEAIAGVGSAFSGASYAAPAGGLLLVNIVDVDNMTEGDQGGQMVYIDSTGDNQPDYMIMFEAGTFATSVEAAADVSFIA